MIVEKNGFKYEWSNILLFIIKKCPVLYIELGKNANSHEKFGSLNYISWSNLTIIIFPYFRKSVRHANIRRLCQKTALHML